MEELKKKGFSEKQIAAIQEAIDTGIPQSTINVIGLLQVPSREMRSMFDNVPKTELPENELNKLREKISKEFPIEIPGVSRDDLEDIETRVDQESKTDELKHIADRIKHTYAEKYNAEQLESILKKVEEYYEFFIPIHKKLEAFERQIEEEKQEEKKSHTIVNKLSDKEILEAMKDVVIDLKKYGINEKASLRDLYGRLDVTTTNPYDIPYWEGVINNVKRDLIEMNKSSQNQDMER